MVSSLKNFTHEILIKMAANAVGETWATLDKIEKEKKNAGILKPLEDEQLSTPDTFLLGCLMAVKLADSSETLSKSGLNAHALIRGGFYGLMRVGLGKTNTDTLDPAEIQKGFISGAVSDLGCFVTKGAYEGFKNMQWKNVLPSSIKGGIAGICTTIAIQILFRAPFSEI